MRVRDEEAHERGFRMANSHVHNLNVRREWVCVSFDDRQVAVGCLYTAVALISIVLRLVCSLVVPHRPCMPFFGELNMWRSTSSTRSNCQSTAVNLAKYRLRMYVFSIFVKRDYLKAFNRVI